MKRRLMAVMLLLFNIAYGQKENPFILGKTRFTVISPELIRMEYATDGKFIDNKTLFAINRASLSNDFEVKNNGNHYTITTKRMEVRYNNDGLPFSDLNIRITVFNKTKNYEWRLDSKDDKNLGGAVSTLDALSGPVKTDNGLLSRNGCQVIDDSRKEIFVDNWITERPVNHLRDIYFFAYGTDFKAGLKALTTISGPAPMTRKYVHGSWYCRWWNYTTEDYLDIVKGYKEHDFPLDVLVMDMGWHTQKQATTGMGHANMYGWTGYTWNKDLVPDPAGFIKKLRDDHIAVTLNDHPNDGIRHHEDQYYNFMNAMGEDTSNQHELLFDAGNKKFMNNFFKYALEPKEKIGVDFWWLDWQQDYEMPYVLGFQNLRHLPWINYLYFNHSVNENKRGLLFSRWAGWGSQRTPIQFSGDARSTWEMLKFQVPFTATSGNAGCFFWAHDIGGFSGARNTEQYIRWTQFGLTTSSLRIHSAFDKNLDRRPWLWGAQAENAIKKIYHLRSQLMPYIYSSVWQVHTQSVPLNRSMYIEYPEQEDAYNNPQEFLFGDLLLSAPIVSPGKGEDFTSSQSVWFPADAVWYNLFNNTKEVGGTTKEISADINEFPLYVKGGYPLPMQPYRARMATAILDTVIIRCYPGIIGKKNTYNLYEDDGVSNEYIKGRNAVTAFHYQQLQKGSQIIIDPVQGDGYRDEPLKRAYRIELPIIKIKTVLVNGKKTLSKHDTNLNTDYVLLDKADIHKTLRVDISQ